MFVFDSISALRDEIVCQDRLGTDTQKENLNKWYRMRAQNVFAYDGCVQNRGDKGALLLMYSMEFFSEIDQLARQALDKHKAWLSKAWLSSCHCVFLSLSQAASRFFAPAVTNRTVPSPTTSSSAARTLGKKMH